MKSLQKLKNFILAKLKKTALFKKPQNPFEEQTEIDQKLVFGLRKKGGLPSFKQLKQLPKTLSKKEAVWLKIFGWLIIFSLLFSATSWYWQNVEIVPRAGGDYTEGIVGAPVYINPILAQTNDVDLDLSRLIFSSLMKYDKDGNLAPDLVADYQISEDQTVYTFTLKDNVVWHDQKPLSADDVVFTVKSIQNQEFKSPLLISLRGVKIEKTGDNQISFTLKTPYTPFLSILTFGVLPEHVWGNIPPANSRLAELNLKPIGSGPWQFKALTRDRQGNLKSYSLEPNENYYGDKPYLKQLVFKFYAGFDEAVQALANKQIQGISFIPQDYTDQVAKNKNAVIKSLRLPQYTAVFFNRRANVLLKNEKIRQSLAMSIDKNEIINQALKNEGEAIDGPILPGYLGYHLNIKKYSFDLETANRLLDLDGWNKITPKEYLEAEQKLKAEEESADSDETDEDSSADSGAETSADEPAETGEEIEIDLDQEFFRQKKDSLLKISLTTVDQPEYVKAAEIIKQSWQKIGVRVDLIIIEGTKIQQEVISPRGYQALLFGEIIGSDPDPYPFWHSSQTEDPGLNLALFANSQADKLIIEARQTNNLEEREKKYIAFQDILAGEIPAIFLYNPIYTYVIDKTIKGFAISRIILPADRFNGLEQWFIKTKRKLF